MTQGKHFAAGGDHFAALPNKKIHTSKGIARLTVTAATMVAMTGSRLISPFAAFPQTGDGGTQHPPVMSPNAAPPPPASASGAKTAPQTIADLQKAVDEAKAKEDAAKASYDEAAGPYNEAASARDQAKASYDSAVSAGAAADRAAMDEYARQVAEGKDAADAAGKDLEQAKAGLADAKADASEKDEAYQSALKAAQDAKDALDKAKADAVGATPEAIRAAEQAVRDAQADEQAMAAMLAHIADSFEICIPEDKVPAVAGLAIAMKRLVKKYGCNAGAIQCWNALQDELGIMPCAANAILNEMGIPIVCETDIHGAITALMVEAADLGRHRGMFADWTVRHPDNENGELLQHCGPWPCSCAAVKPKLTYPLAFDHPGALTAEAKHGDLTLARFDGDNGEYSLLLGNARGIDGPAGMGTYLWVEVDNLKRLEAKIVEGPYIHHCVAIHANVVPVLYEACKYIGIAPDLYDPIEEDVKAYLRGE